jgi:branched-chain amino acid transport system permease protein
MLDYLVHILILINIYSILTMSFSLAMGYTGLPCFATPAFFAMGAYGSAFLTTMGVPFILAVPLSGVIAGLFAYAMSYPALKMQGDYFAIVTLGFSEITRLVLLNESARYSSAGDVGIVGLAPASLFGIDLMPLPRYFLLTLAFMGLSYLILRRLVLSPYGRVIRAIRDDEPVTDVIGKDTRAFKVEVLVTVGFFGGIGGSLFGHYIQFVHPTQFTPDLLVFLLAAVVLFNEANITGAIFGTAFMVALPEAMRFLGLPESYVGALRLMIMGVAVVAIILLRERSRSFYARRSVARK